MKVEPDKCHLPKIRVVDTLRLLDDLGQVLYNALGSGEFGIHLAEDLDRVSSPTPDIHPDAATGILACLFYHPTYVVHASGGDTPVIERHGMHEDLPPCWVLVQDLRVLKLRLALEEGGREMVGPRRLFAPIGVEVIRQNHRNLDDVLVPIPRCVSGRGQ